MYRLAVTDVARYELKLSHSNFFISEFFSVLKPMKVIETIDHSSIINNIEQYMKYLHTGKYKSVFAHGIVFMRGLDLFLPCAFCLTLGFVDVINSIPYLWILYIFAILQDINKTIRMKNMMNILHRIKIYVD